MVLNQAKLGRNYDENSRRCTKQSICFRCLGKIANLWCRLCGIIIHQPGTGIEPKIKESFEIIMASLVKFIHNSNTRHDAHNKTLDTHSQTLSSRSGTLYCMFFVSVLAMVMAVLAFGIASMALKSVTESQRKNEETAKTKKQSLRLSTQTQNLWRLR